jgi:hypothetical protein
MAEIDRLGWAAGRSILAFGVRLGLRVTEAPALLPLLDRLPAGWRVSPSPLVTHLYSVVFGADGGRVKRFHVVYAGIERICRTLDREVALRAFALDVGRRLAAFAPHLLFLEAGVVGWRGRAIVLPGSRGSGRTRLVAALVEAGAQRYSEEYAVLDERGRLHAYGSGLAERDLPPLQVGLVVVAPYSAGARWRPRTLTPGEGLLELFAHAPPARRKPRSVLARLRRVTVPVLKGRRGEAVQAARDILSRLDIP